MVDLGALEIPAVILLALCAGIILISRNWRLSIFGLALQYVGVVVLIASAWTILMALTKLVAGWIACAVLAATMQDIPSQPDEEAIPVQMLNLAGLKISVNHLASDLFGLLAAAMIALVVLSITPVASIWVPGITPHLAAGSVLLIGLGGLQLGMTSQPFRVILGLLTVLSGFEIIYAAVETSLLVAGLLSGVTLGLALVGSYLITGPQSSS